MFSQKKLLSPAKPSLALNITVVAHRQSGSFDFDLSALRERIVTVLGTIGQSYRQIAASTGAQNLFVGGEPLPPRILSPLAERVERLAADAALAQGYALQCPLPFPVDVYAGDFQEDDSWLKEFNALLGRAERVLELDGSRKTREREDRAYRNVGRFVLNHSDIVLAVCDKDEEGEIAYDSKGVVASALRQELPIIWINAVAPHSVQLHSAYNEGSSWLAFDDADLADFLQHLLLPPDVLETPQSEQEKISPGFFQKLKQCCLGELNSRLVYFSHDEPRRNLLGSVYRIFFNLLGKCHVTGLLGNSYRQDAETQWQQTIGSAGSLLPDGTLIREQFIIADCLANYYADQYRGTFISCFLLSAVAVLFALLGAPFVDPADKVTVFPALELVALALMMIMVVVGRMRGLHPRWLDFRLLAESLRQQAFLASIGGGVELWQPTVFKKIQKEDYSYAWINWLLRAIDRAEGIPRGKFEKNFLQDYHRYLTQLIKDQARYHELNAERSERIAQRLHSVNLIMFGAIVTACFLHIVWHTQTVAYYSTLAAAVMPAFGAAIFGILNQGEFERIAERSKGMASHLQAIAKELEDYSEASAGKLLQQAQKAIDVMSQELSDWRMIFRIKPLELHA